MARPAIVLAVLVAALSVVATAPAAPKPTGIQHFFYGPGPSTSCEIDIGVPKLGTLVHCQTYPHAESVILRPTGKLTICHGVPCIGAPHHLMPTLVYGSWERAGPFRCDSTHAGIKCVVVKTGRGFLMSPTSIKQL
jgi:hypothetical protein